MTQTSSAQPDTAGREIVITRVFDAPRALVFRAWTDPEHLPHWLGPKGFTNTTVSIDVRPGGMWRFIMHGPDGAAFPNRIVYDEIVPPERLVYTHDNDVDGVANNTFQVTVMFAEQGGQTTLTMRMLFPSAAARQRVVDEFHAIEGVHQTMDRLADYLAQMAA
jgi:uncharacterized protein YndB with AHSA1/START domain